MRFKYFFFLILIFFFSIIPSYSDEFSHINTYNTEFKVKRVQDILRIWTEIEHQLSAENIDKLQDSIQTYLNSELYRIFRLAPFSSQATFGPSVPNEIPEIQIAAGLLFTLREAVLENDTDLINSISNDIYSNLVHAMIRDTETEQFAGSANFRLFVVLVFIIIISFLLIYFLYKELDHSLLREKESSVYSRLVILAQEEERLRLNRELHDTIIQDLRFLSLEMNKISKTTGQTEREKLCSNAAELQSELIRRVRDICEYLIPPDFRIQGLPDALRGLCFKFGERTGLDCRIDITENIDINFLNDEKKLQLFRIIQEALNNVEKHAKATEAIVILRSDPNGDISAGISDDGKGFNMQESSIGTGKLGIRGMNERAALLGGSLEIKSEPGEGTFVRLIFNANSAQDTKKITGGDTV